jgi:hypothetical protein
MSVQGISSITNPYLPNVQNSSSTLGNDIKNLVTAIQSGDLKSAQNAFSQIQGVMQTSQETTAEQSGGQQSQFNADFAALGNALQSGDISGAQDALKKLGQDLQPQSTGKAHHHHHHHGGGAPSQSTASTTGVTAPIGSASSSGSNVNVLV